MRGKKARALEGKIPHGGFARLYQLVNALSEIETFLLHKVPAGIDNSSPS